MVDGLLKNYYWKYVIWKLYGNSVRKQSDRHMLRWDITNRGIHGITDCICLPDINEKWCPCDLYEHVFWLIILDKAVIIWNANNIIRAASLYSLLVGCDSPITSYQVTYLRELASPCQFSFVMWTWYHYTYLMSIRFVKLYLYILFIRQNIP